VEMDVCLRVEGFVCVGVCVCVCVCGGGGLKFEGWWW